VTGVANLARIDKIYLVALIRRRVFQQALIVPWRISYYALTFCALSSHV